MRDKEKKKRKKKFSFLAALGMSKGPDEKIPFSASNAANVIKKRKKRMKEVLESMD